MLLLSLQGRQQRRSTVSYKPASSSSPSFWIAQAVGAVLVCQPDVIERWLPMVAPFPATIREGQRRTTVNRILEECWDNNMNDPNGNSGYEIQAMDEWIVDNQKQNRNEQEIKNHGEREVEQETEFQSQKSIRAGSRQHQDTGASTTTTKSADSFFSNYFLSLHLLFSLPSIGEENDDDVIDSTSDTFSSSEKKRRIMSSLAMKPSTYGEITPLGTRQLFGAMGLLDRTTAPDSFAAHFVDLGSGTGKVVGQAVVELSSKIDKATGVELSPSRHQSAIRAKEALVEWLLHRRQPNGNEGIIDWYSSTCSTSVSNFSMEAGDLMDIDKKLELIEGDLFDVDLSTATHIYIASLCFPDNLMLRLEEALCQRIARQQHHQRHQHHHHEDQTRNDNDTDDNDTNDTAGEVANLQWIATLRQFPNDLGGIQPIVRFMEMSWTSPLGCAVYLYRCDTVT